MNWPRLFSLVTAFGLGLLIPIAGDWLKPAEPVAAASEVEAVSCPVAPVERCPETQAAPLVQASPASSQPPSAGTASEAGPSEVEVTLRAQLADAQRRTGHEEELIAANSTLALRIQQLEAQVAGIRTEVTATADDTTLREAAKVEQRAEAQRHVSELVQVERHLATGDTEGATSAIDAALASVGPLARTEFEAARTALENEDLARARRLLREAIADAEARR